MLNVELVQLQSILRESVCPVSVGSEGVRQLVSGPRMSLQCPVSVRCEGVS